MRITIIILFLTISSILSSGQASEESNSERVVRQVMKQAAEGIYTSWGEKDLGRLGDAAAVELTKIIGGKALSERDIDQILLVIQLSFGALRTVEIPSNREPRTALFVLQSLTLSTADLRLKGRIADIRKYVLDQYASASHSPQP